MFKLIGQKTTKNGIVSIEQFFTEGEKDFAVATAARLSDTAGFSDVRLLDATLARIKVTTLLPTIKDGAFETKAKFVTGVKLAWVKFAPAKPKAAKKPRAAKKVIEATAEGFDLPAKTKRVSKRQRAFGIEADKSLAAAE